MKKRQRKKNEKKYLPIICDEFNLITMTDEEREQAHQDYLVFRKKYAFRKKYKNLKRPAYLVYYYPMGKQFQRILSDLALRVRKQSDNH